MGEKVYQRSREEAAQRGEIDLYRESHRLNNECLRAIDEALQASNYKPNLYNIEAAADSVIGTYGFERLNWVLASVLQQNQYDGRYSSGNKAWALEYDTPSQGRNYYVNAHPTLVDSFVDWTRQKYREYLLTAPLPGEPGGDEVVQGYEIKQAILFSDSLGFALAENPNAASPYVTWQFSIADESRDYFWGHYFNDEGKARENFIARLTKYMADNDVTESKPLDHTPASVEATQAKEIDVAIKEALEKAQSKFLNTIRELYASGKLDRMDTESVLRDYLPSTQITTTLLSWEREMKAQKTRNPVI